MLATQPEPHTLSLQVPDFQLFSFSEFQLLPLMLLPLNPDYDPIPVAPHEGSEMVVVGEWVASID
jgi:hypothetical protein